jgi:hypothetical protein
MRCFQTENRSYNNGRIAWYSVQQVMKLEVGHFTAELVGTTQVQHVPD